MADSDPFRHIRELARSMIPGATATTEPLPAQPSRPGIGVPEASTPLESAADNKTLTRRRGRRPERDDTTRRMAAALKRARLQKGTTQRDLGQLIGVPQSHISKIEAGAVDLRISSLVVLARALDLSLELNPARGEPGLEPTPAFEPLLAGDAPANP